MSEQKSDPNQTSNQPLDANSVSQALNKISAIAAQESIGAVSDIEKAKREAEAYEGNTSDSALINQFAQLETDRENAKLKNEQLQSTIRRYNLENESLEHKNKEEVILDEARRNYTRLC